MVNGEWWMVNGSLRFVSTTAIRRVGGFTIHN